MKKTKFIRKSTGFLAVLLILSFCSLPTFGLTADEGLAASLPETSEAATSMPDESFLEEATEEIEETEEADEAEETGEIPSEEDIDMQADGDAPDSEEPESPESMENEENAVGEAPQAALYGAPGVQRAPALLADSAEITSIQLLVDGVAITPGTTITVTRDTVVKLSYEWKIRDGYDTNSIAAGDYALLGALPDGLPFAADVTTLSPIEVKTTGDITVGFITFVKNGAAIDILLTYAEGIVGMENVSGTFYLESQINFSEINIPGDTLDLMLQDDGSFRFTEGSKPSTTISKRFVKATYRDDEANQEYRFDTLEWEIDVNTRMDTIANATIIDTVSQSFSSGATSADAHSFQNVRVEVYHLQVTNGGAGNVHLQQGEKLDPAEYSATITAEDTLEISLGTISTAYRIVVKSDVDLIKLQGYSWVSVVFHNKATLNGEQAQAETTMRLNHPQNAKDGSYWLADDHMIYWRLYINRHNLDYGADGLNLTVQDFLPTGLEFRDNDGDGLFDFELYELVYDPVTDDETHHLVYSFQYGNINGPDILDQYFTQTPYLTDNGQTANFPLKSINDTGYQIVMHTRVADLEAFAREAFTNNGHYKVGDFDAWMSAWVAAPPELNRVALTKQALADEITYSTMSWRIDYNAGDQQVAAGMEFRDTFRCYDNIDQRLLPETLAVTVDDVALDETQYTLAYGPDGTGSDYTGGFLLTLHDAFTGNVVITYKTEYSPYLTDPDTGTARGGTVYNDIVAVAYLSQGSTPTERRDTASQSIPDRYTVNGLKDGAYSIENDTITWTIDFNYRRADLGTQVTLEDVFGSNQAYIGTEDDLEVYKWVNDDFVPVTAGEEYEILVSPVGSQSGFTLLFPDMGVSYYRIIYRTGVVDPGLPLALYSNQCIARGGNIGTSYEFMGYASKLSDSSLLSKGVEKDAGNANLLHYTVLVNGSQSTLFNAEVTDKLSRGLILDKDSIQVAVTGGAELIAGTDYELTFPDDATTTQTEFVVKFINNYDPLTVPISITYSAGLDAGNAQPDVNTPGYYLVSNEVQLSADMVLTWSTINNSTYITTGGGSADGKQVGYIQVRKMDVDSNAPLAGAVFEVLEADGHTLVTTLTTRETGFSEIISLQPGTYYLREITAPAGYVLDDTPHQFTVVRTNITQVIERTNALSTGQLRVLKVDAETRAVLAGARFQVLDADSTVLASLVTGSDGYSDIITLPLGQYQLVETIAPAGYILDDTPHPFAVTETDVVLVLERENEKEPSPTTSIPPSTSQPVDPSTSNPPPSSSDPSTSTPPPASSDPSTSIPPTTTSDTPGTTPPATSDDPVAPPAAVTPITPAVVAPVPPAADATPAPATPTPVPETEPDTPEPPTAPDDLTELAPEDAPLADLPAGPAWSLLNLLMSVVSLLTALVLLLSMLQRRRLDEAENDEDWEDEPKAEEPKQRNRLTLLRLPAMFLGVVPGILFLILENIRLPMTWITQWTPIIGLAFLAHMAFVIVHAVIKKRSEDNSTGDDEGPGTQMA